MSFWLTGGQVCPVHGWGTWGQDTGGFFNNCCSSRGAPGQRNWGHPGREFLPSENEEKEGISWIKLSGMKSALTALCPLEESSQNLKNPEKPLQIPTDPDKRLQNLKNP